MPKKEPSAKYEFVFLEEENVSYFFQTDYQLTYEVSFKPTFYIFEPHLPFANWVYELVIKIFDNASDKIPPTDPIISVTIVAIFQHFFSNHTEKIIVYVCDTSDRKHLARYRKFNRWFEFHNDDEFRKMEVNTTDELKDVTYFNTLIVKRTNPYLAEIEIAFRDVFAEEKWPKLPQYRPKRWPNTK